MAHSSAMVQQAPANSMTRAETWEKVAEFRQFAILSLALVLEFTTMLVG